MMCHIYEYNNLDSILYFCSEVKYFIYLKLLLDVESNTGGLWNSVHIENVGLKLCVKSLYSQKCCPYRKEKHFVILFFSIVFTFQHKRKLLH